MNGRRIHGSFTGLGPPGGMVPKVTLVDVVSRLRCLPVSCDLPAMFIMLHDVYSDPMIYRFYSIIIFAI